MEPFPLRVLVADARPVAREAWVASLERAGLQVVGVVSDADGAVEMARRTCPDVALVDVHVPGGGVRATEAIVGSVKGCRVIALPAHGDSGAILQMLLAGAGGYVARGTSSDELPEVVRRVARAEAGVPADVVTRLLDDLFREIADLSANQERLRRGEERFRGLLEAAPDAVVIVDARGEIILVNQQAELMFGYTRSDLIGRPLEFLVPERFHDAHIAHRRAYHSAPRTRRMGTASGLAGRRMDASEFPVDISLSALETDEGTLVIAFIRELSERGWATGPAHEPTVRVDDAHRERGRLADAAAPDGRSPDVLDDQVRKG
jgi:PAS domain S-box-containing protein